MRSHSYNSECRRSLLAHISWGYPLQIFFCTGHPFAFWAFVGSFMWDGDQEPTWGWYGWVTTFIPIIHLFRTCLAVFNITLTDPWVLSLITATRLLHLSRQIHTASSTLLCSVQCTLAGPNSVVHGDSRGVPAKSMVALCLVRICLRLALAVAGHNLLRMSQQQS